MKKENRCGFWIAWALLGGSLVTLGQAVPVAVAESSSEMSAPVVAPQRDLTEYSMEDLLNIRIQVASTLPKNRRQAPGIVSVITREELEKSGARDLLDVLRSVPGFEFGVDSWGVSGLGFRGLWGAEGKILLRIDGQEMNELMYTGLQLGNHYPVDQMERIEIIRGPGSAIYGGYAELAVIDIITKIGAEQPGFHTSVTSGFYRNTFARQNVQASFGHSFGRGSYLGVSVFQGFGQRSNLEYTDFSGNTYNLRDNARLDPRQVNFHLRHGDLHVRFLFDHYHTTERDGYGAVLPQPVDNDFLSYFADVAYDIRLGQDWVLSPQFRFKGQQPWRSVDVSPTDLWMFYNATAYRYRPSLKLSYQSGGDLSALAGVQSDLDEAQYGDAGSLVFQNGEKSIFYRTLALFGEATYQNPIADITAGLRFENKTSFGSHFAPRVALTKLYRDFHGKFIYNHAFRYPSLEQNNGGNAVKPEKTDVFELEAGYKISDAMFVTANVYNIRMKKPLVYYFDSSTGNEGYVNSDKLGTRGVELEYRLRGRLGYATLNYSYYRAAYRGAASLLVPGQDNLFLGFPAHKAGVTVSWQATEHLSVNPNLVFLSKRYGYNRQDPGSGDPLLYEDDPLYLVNLYLQYRDVFWKGLDLGAGVYDLFGQNYRFIQPYNAGHAPLPGPSREYLIKVVYRGL